MEKRHSGEWRGKWNGLSLRRMLHCALNRQSKLTALTQIEKRGVCLRVLLKLIPCVLSGLGLTH
jgi:hypothetical protein